MEEEEIQVLHSERNTWSLVRDVHEQLVAEIAERRA